MNYTCVTTMKNEAPYILEWVAHHRALGFSNIIIATNDCTDTTVPLIARLEELGYATLHKTIIRRGGIQRSALRQACLRYDSALNADWLYICDADEFLNIKVGEGKIDDLLSYTNDETDAVSIPWKIFGPSGVSQLVDTPVIEQFKYTEKTEKREKVDSTGKFKKTIYRNFEKYRRPGLHQPVVRDEFKETIKFEYPGGLKFKEIDSFEGVVKGFEVAQVNHYALRSIDSYLVKRDRGRANHTSHVLGTEYWNKFNYNEVEDTSISLIAPETLRILEELKSDPLLKELHEDGVLWHSLKSRELRRDKKLKKMVAHMEETNIITAE